MREIAPTQALLVAPSRRGFFAGASAAVLVPVATVAAPVSGQPPAAQENVRLLAIGKELDALLERHAAADVALEAAEKLALATCPSVPDSMKPGPRDRYFWGSIRSTLDPEVDALGAPVGPFVTIRGQRHPVPAVASSRVIENAIKCAFYLEEERKQLAPRLAIARAYEAEREAALLSAGLPQAVAELNAAAHAVWDLVEETSHLPATSSAGILIKARVLQAAAFVWDEYGGSHGRLKAAAASQDFIASVIEVLQSAAQ